MFTELIKKHSVKLRLFKRVQYTYKHCSPFMGLKNFIALENERFMNEVKIASDDMMRGK